MLLVKRNMMFLFMHKKQSNEHLWPDVMTSTQKDGFIFLYLFAILRSFFSQKNVL